nr:DUF1016 N-terminal domain-containing protein [Deinococcus roseus]
MQTSQLQALLKVNQQLLMLYWKIGKTILFLQQEHGWGTHGVDHLAIDLKAAFPGMTGFGRRNLQYMTFRSNLPQ